MILSSVTTRFHLALICKVKRLINENIDIFQCYIHSNKDPKLFSKVEYLQKKLKSFIKAIKEKYYSRISKRMMNSFNFKVVCQ